MPLLHRCQTPAVLAPAQGGYSHAVEVVATCHHLYVSGQIPVRPDGQVPDSFAAQCQTVWDNLLAVLAHAHYEPRHLVKLTTFLSSSSFGDENAAIRRERLGDLRPALTVIITGIYDPSWLLEIEAVAAKPV